MVFDATATRHGRRVPTLVRIGITTEPMLFDEGRTMSRVSRRQFTKHTAGVIAGGIVPYVYASCNAFANLTANDRPHIGCIGVGNMGSGDGREHAKYGEIVAICDVDLRHAERAGEDGKIGKDKADIYQDYRRVLDRRDIDVVSIATPDHWHTKIAIEALEAGKHVFCQKPLTLTLEENQLIRKACEKHLDKVFFVGTQQRASRQHWLRAVNMVQKGILGNINKIVVGIDGSPTGGPFPKISPPQELDWNQWQGQAAWVDYREKRCHDNFRWWYEYSGGKFTDWGAHHVDIATWAIGQHLPGMGPVKVDGSDAQHPVAYQDGYAMRDDCYNASHDFSIRCQFANGMEMIVESRGDNGVTFEGSEGRIFVNRGKITGKPIEEEWDKGSFTESDLVRLYKGKPFEGHKDNFYRCIREGGLPVSDVFSHVQILNTCHLCTVAARLGRSIAWDPVTETILADAQAASFVSRNRREGYDILDV